MNSSYIFDVRAYFVDNLHPGLLTGLLILLLACSAFFSSSETGLLSLNRYRTRHAAKEGNKSAQRALRLLEHPDRLLGTILVGNNFVNILASSLATVLAMQLWGEAGIAIATIGLTVALLIFGEITPKTLAAQRPELVAYPFSLPLLLLQMLLYPLVILLSWVSKLLLRLLKINLQDKSDESLSTEELRSLVREAGNTLPVNHQNMMLSILDLEQMTVDDVMIPRNEVTGIDLDSSLDSILTQLRTTPYTRLPVYHKDINQVRGVVHMRQLARLLSHDKLTKESLLEACLEPYFIPQNTPLSTQLLNFQKERRRIAMVVDEYGDVLGIVTLENILTEIVGEFDSQELFRTPDIHPQPDGTYIIEGTAHLRDINRALGWTLPCDGPRTLNGLVTEALEQIPNRSVCLQVGEYRMETLQTVEKRVKAVRIWPLALVLPEDQTAEPSVTN